MQARGIAVVGVVANNGIWALEKHPMEAIYGYSVVADLRPETRYDKLAGALGCGGGLVRGPAGLRPAFERGLGVGGLVLVSVLVDLGVACWWWVYLAWSFEAAAAAS